MKNQLLLLEDVHGVGRKGDIVSVKPGFARNYLYPQQKAVLAEKHLIRLQERLRQERAAQAIVDKKEAEELAQMLKGKTLKTQVKVDQEGHLYGSVSSQDIVALFEEQLNILIDRRNIVLLKPIKALGVYEVDLRLQEGVPAMIILEIVAEEKKEE